jgi:DNA repair protein RadC
VIVAHNHPSGDPEPSTEDIEVTGKIFEAGQLLDIELLDHIIIGEKKWVSLKTRRLF